MMQAITTLTLLYCTSKVNGDLRPLPVVCGQIHSNLLYLQLIKTRKRMRRTIIHIGQATRLFGLYYINSISGEYTQPVVDNGNEDGSSITTCRSRHVLVLYGECRCVDEVVLKNLRSKLLFSTAFPSCNEAEHKVRQERD